MYEIGDIASVRDLRCIISPYSSWVKCHTHDRLKVELDEWYYSAHEAQNTLHSERITKYYKMSYGFTMGFLVKNCSIYVYYIWGQTHDGQITSWCCNQHRYTILHVKYWIMNYIKLYEVRIDLWFILKWVEKTKSYSSLIFFFIILRAFHVHFKKMCHHLWLAVSRVGIFKIELKELYLFINSKYVY